MDDDLNMRYSSEDEEDYDEEYIYPEFEESMNLVSLVGQLSIL